MQMKSSINPFQEQNPTKNNKLQNKTEIKKNYVKSIRIEMVKNFKYLNPKPLIQTKHLGKSSRHKFHWH